MSKMSGVDPKLLKKAYALSEKVKAKKGITKDMPNKKCKSKK